MNAACNQYEQSKIRAKSVQSQSVVLWDVKFFTAVEFNYFDNSQIGSSKANRSGALVFAIALPEGSVFGAMWVLVSSE